MQDVSLKTKFVRTAAIVLIASVIVGGLCLIWPKYQRGESLKAQSAALDAQILEKRLQITELKDKQNRFKTDPDFVEQIARENRRVYPGELVFVFGKDGKDK